MRIHTYFLFNEKINNLEFGTHELRPKLHTSVSKLKCSTLQHSALIVWYTKCHPKSHFILNTTSSSSSSLFFNNELQPDSKYNRDNILAQITTLKCTAIASRY